MLKVYPYNLLRIAYLYSKEDFSIVKEIDNHINDLKYECNAHVYFYSTDIFPSSNLPHEFDKYDIIIIFIGNEYNNLKDKWNSLSQKNENIFVLGGTRVVSILLSTLHIKDVPFATREFLPQIDYKSTKISINAMDKKWWQFSDPTPLGAVPGNIRAVSDWPTRDDAFNSILWGLRAIIEEQWFAHGMLLANFGGEGSDDEEALASFEEALRLNPSNASAWYEKAFILYRLSLVSEAMSACEQALKLDPDLIWAWYLKGLIFIKQKWYNDAYQALLETIRLDPTYRPARYALGQLLIRLERYDESIKTYNEALEIDILDSEAWYGKSEALHALGHWLEAWKARRKAYQLGWSKLTRYKLR